jgi:hypothetical protein
VFDEVQRCPALFSYLQGIVDAERRPGRFILTGSQQFGLLSGISQSLAGRVGRLQLLPFSLDELSTVAPPPSLEELLYAGLYPPVRDRNLPPHVWYADYTATYVERDVRQMVNVRDLAAFRRFVRMCATRSGRIEVFGWQAIVGALDALLGVGRGVARAEPGILTIRRFAHVRVHRIIDTFARLTHGVIAKSLSVCVEII